MAVHHVDVNAVGAGLLGLLHLLAEFCKVRRQDRRRQLDVLGVDHSLPSAPSMPAVSRPAAALSTYHTSCPVVGRISCDGSRVGSGGPLSTSSTRSALSAPVTRNSISRALFRIGRVSVSRSGGGFGALATCTTHRVVSLR